MIVTVGASKTFRLTLANGAGSQQYAATVVVSLPGGQGPQDITAQGNPVALITTPTGIGSQSIEVIRDGVAPPPGTNNPGLQYDTFTGSTRTFDWIGYEFAPVRRFSSLTFQEGMEFPDGGWFTQLKVQVKVNGQWTDVSGLTSSPAYAGANGISFETYELNFVATEGTGIRIAGTPGGGNTFISVGELRAFESQAGPALVAPMHVSPSNGSTGQAVTSMLRWNRSAGATGYHLQVSTASGFSSLLVNDSSLTDTSRQLSALLNSTTYYWRVRSRNANDASAFSTPWSFTTILSIPSVPIHVSPANNATKQSVHPKLVWRKSQGTETYRLQVALDTSFTVKVVDDSTLVDTSLVLPTLQNNTPFYWRVRGKNAVGSSNFSSRWKFTTKRARRDVTTTAAVKAHVTNPLGSGNPNIEVIRDGQFAPVGSTDPMLQYDTYSGGSPSSFDWIGYEFPVIHSFSNIEFQQGIVSSAGGWFDTLKVQVRSAGVWSDVEDLTIHPPYTGGAAVSFERYELNFTVVDGDGIRIAGTPGGSHYFISVAEFRALDDDTTLSGVHPGALPVMFTLEQNYPNPFNPSTKIRYTVPSGAHVELSVFDILGREVATVVNAFHEQGSYAVDFNAENLANGVYLYMLRAGSFTDMKKMILLK
jgi:hypothetical protein